MPRFEKQGKSKEQFLEVELVEAQVYESKGSRAKGAKDWTVKDSDERRYGFSGDVKKAKALFAETTAKALKDGFVQVGDAVPRITAMRARQNADAARNEASLAVSKSKKAATDAERAEWLARAKTKLAAWDEALAQLPADEEKGFEKLYGDDIERLKAATK